MGPPNKLSMVLPRKTGEVVVLLLPTSFLLPLVLQRLSPRLSHLLRVSLLVWLSVSLLLTFLLSTLPADWANPPPTRKSVPRSSPVLMVTWKDSLVTVMRTLFPKILLPI